MTHTTSPTPVAVLAVAAHPDDAELACAGTLAKLTAQGHAAAILDLTRGELGTRGTADLRDLEAAQAARILGVQRANARMADGFFQNDPDHQRRLIGYIRAFRPRLVLANAPEDRHPDHGRAGALIRDACFLAGLRRIETQCPFTGQPQQAHRPQLVLHYIQDKYLTPSLVVDISGYFDTKLAAIRAYGSQFYDPNSPEPDTYISSPQFWQQIEARCRMVGHLVGAEYGEGFIAPGPLRYDSLADLL